MKSSPLKHIRMDFQPLITEKFNLYLYDTGRRDVVLTGRGLRTKLRKGLCILEDLVFSARVGPINLSKGKVSTIECSLSLCGKKKIRQLNKQYRRLDKVTDVLSFPIHQNLRGQKFKNIQPPGPINLGDIIICKEKARTQAKEFGISVDAEIIHLWVHGLLHLMGYDHEVSRKEEELMNNWEDKILRNIL